MHPNLFDADSEIQYKSGRRTRTVERHRLAQLANVPRSDSAWQTRLGALREAGSARMAAWLAAIGGAARGLRETRGQKSVQKPREQCC